MGDSYNQHWRINSLQIVENSLCLRSKCTVIFEKRELVKLTMWKFRANLHMHPEFTEYLLTIHWQAVYFWVVSQAKRGNLDMTYENYLYSVQRSNTWRNYKLRWVRAGLMVLNDTWGGHLDFWFCGFGYFYIGFSVLCQKPSFFQFWCSLRFADFPFF